MFFFVLLSYLPFRALFILSDALYWVVYRLLGYRTKVVRQNLQNSFPDKDPVWLKMIERAFYRHLCDVVVETIKLLSISREELSRRVDLAQLEAIRDVVKQGQSALVLTPHFGNWEWILAASQLKVGAQVDAVYKPLSSPFFDRLMLRIRSRFGSLPVPSPQILRIEASRRHITRVIALVADQTPGPQQACVLPFLHQSTLFFRGPQKLAQTFGYPVFYVSLFKTGRGRYRLRCTPIVYKDQEEDFIIKTFAGLLEADIREQPALWLWSHKRWKHKIPGE